MEFANWRRIIKMPHEKGHNNFKHMWMMVLACAIPLVIILLIPSLGISGKWITILAVGLMIILHMVLMKDHSSIHDKKHKGGDKDGR